MFGRISGILALAMVMSLMGNAMAADLWWGGGALWSSPGNWNSGTVPTVEDQAGINAGTCEIDDTVDAVCARLLGPGWVGDAATLNITGGSLTIETFWRMSAHGGGSAQGVINVSGGTVQADNIVIGQHSTGTLNIEGGTVISANQIELPWGDATADSYINLKKGVLESLNNGVRFRNKGVDTQIGTGSGYLDIEQGILIVSGDWINGGWPLNYTDAIDMGLLTAYGGKGRVEIVYDEVTNKTTVKGIHPLEPNPADGSSVLSSLNELSWILPEPNDSSVLGAQVTCVVYFGTNPVVENNPVLADRLAAQSITIPSLASLTTYYWALDIYDSSYSDTAPIDLSPVFTFDTQNQAPIVDAGEDVTTWLTDGAVDVEFAGTVVDEDGMPEPYRVLWTAVSEPNEGDAVFAPSGADQEALTVTLTAVGQYVLQLEATDGELTGVDLVTINAFNDGCEAAKSLPDYVPFPGDLNGDCIVDDLDLAILQEDWLKCNSLDCLE